MMPDTFLKQLVKAMAANRMKTEIETNFHSLNDVFRFTVLWFLF